MKSRSLLPLFCCFLPPAVAGELLIYSDRPNAITVPQVEARFVRFVIAPNGSSSEPCIDELEVYEEDSPQNIALWRNGGRATASSCLQGYPQHAISHLNDGEYGNAHSWIAAGTGEEWAQIELARAARISRVVFSRDRTRRYGDRVPFAFEIRLSRDGKEWRTVRKVRATAVSGARAGRQDAAQPFVPSPPPPPSSGTEAPRPQVPEPRRERDSTAELADAFLAEEHAWLKTYGRADLDPRLVPYNGRVKEYPRHAGDDHLPLPPVSSRPELDGSLVDATWREASRGTVRVAFPYDFDKSPLVEHEVRAGWKGSDLYLAIRTDRLLSSHVAVLSSADWQGCGVVTFKGGGLVLNTYSKDGKLEESLPVDGAVDTTLTCFELRLPLSLFPDCRERGLRVGLGMGGKHTSAHGRPVIFVFSSLSLAEVAPGSDRTFHVRLAVPPGAAPTSVKGNAPGLENVLTLRPGDSRTLEIAATRGAIGPEYELEIDEEGAGSHKLHLFRYDPLERTLRLMSDLLDRLSAKGLDVRAERTRLVEFRNRQESILDAREPDLAVERRTFFAARLAKRRLFLREPDLAPVERILFVKRRPYEPSHIYTDYTDAPFRPGGGVCVLDIPRRDGRFEPSEARVSRLFDSGDGIARDPVATFDLSKIYFGYRPAASGYYHLWAMNADGSDLRRVTDGPFHDFYPCPLPDGALAFITTRCISRVFCFRGGSSVLFRLNPETGDTRPLSHSSLSEWAPSVMADGRIIWTRWEYMDKGADFSQTLWSVHPDGSKSELVFGNTINQPNGYACGREVPGTSEISCTLVSHFGDINGPIALVDLDKGPFDPKAIQSITPEVPWPGMWPREECFRDPFPLARDYFLCSHAPRDRFGLYVIDRFGNRELLYLDAAISSMTPTPFRATTPPPVLADTVEPEQTEGQFVVLDVYQGIEPAVERGTVKYLRVVEEVRHTIEMLPSGEYRKDHAKFIDWYATPVDKVSGPYGWPAYVAKAPLGIVRVEADGSANFRVPAGKSLYFQALDKDFNELQRMRSVVHLQGGERRTCVGCHEGRHTAPPTRQVLAVRRKPDRLEPPPWGAGPFSFEKVVQPVLDARCVHCHDGKGESKLDLTSTLDVARVPASYRTLISGGWVHYVDCGWNSGGCEKKEPLSFGTVKSKLWSVLDGGHYGAELTPGERRRIKTWTDLNCPLWPDYIEREKRPGPPVPPARSD